MRGRWFLLTPLIHCIAIPLHWRQFLLAVVTEGESLAIQVNKDGQPSGTAPIRFVDHPDLIAFQYPYIISLNQAYAFLNVHRCVKGGPKPLAPPNDIMAIQTAHTVALDGLLLMPFCC